MKARSLTAIMMAALVLCLAPAATAQVAGTGSAQALSYIQARQNSDGGFSEPGTHSDDTLTAWAVLAGVSGADNPAQLLSSGTRALSYFSSRVKSITDLPEIELCVLSLSETGLDPRNIQGLNMVSLLTANQAKSGKIGKDISQHCLGMIALASAQQKLLPSVTEWLISQQRTDGGWGEKDSVAVTDTALAIEALVASGEARAQTVRPALKFLHGRMNGDGGFSATKDTSNTQVTSSVMRALFAAGEDPTSTSWTIGGLNPASFVQSMQASDGHLGYSKGVDSEPALTTAMAVPALKGKHFPLAAAAMSLGPDSPASNGTTNPPTVNDLGTTGADPTQQSTDGSTADTGQTGTTRSSGTTPSARAATVESMQAGATGRRTGWFNGLWVFLAACLAYLVLLAASAVIAGRLAEPPPILRP